MLVKLEVGDNGSVEGENPEHLKKTKATEPKTNSSTYDIAPGSTPGHIGGRHALSTLLHPCSPNYYDVRPSGGGRVWSCYRFASVNTRRYRDSGLGLVSGIFYL